MVLSQGRTKPTRAFWRQLLEVTRTLCIILCIFFSCVYNQFQWRGLCFGSYSQARQWIWLHFQTSWLAKCQSLSWAPLCTPISYNWPEFCVFPESTSTAQNTNQTSLGAKHRDRRSKYLCLPKVPFLPPGTGRPGPGCTALLSPICQELKTK